MIANGSERKPHALVIEDQPDLAELFTLQLEGLGWCVECACTDSEAFAATRADPPDAIIIDTLLPHSDGGRLVGRLRECLGGRPCRLVISTIYEALDFVDVGADAVLTLPHQLASLQHALLEGADLS